jgi:hypothetical protein
MPHELWPWLVLAGLGVFHGVNPAMGWLFAAALGLHRQRRAVVLESLIPIALGHALAVALVAFAFVALGMVVNPWAFRVPSGVLLIGWALYHWRYGSRHRVRVGMRTGMAGLALWSFVMASAHGAGLMLVPVLLPIGRVGSGASYLTASGSIPITLAAVGVHTLAMLAVTGGIAVGVYEWVGLAFLRRSWINLDWLWTAALVTTGFIVLVTPSH